MKQSSEFFEWMSLILPIVLLVIVYFYSKYSDVKQLKNIRRREKESANFSLHTSPKFSFIPTEVNLIGAAVVLSNNYFSAFSSRLKNLFGGRINIYERLLDRTRRVAILRLKEKAMRYGYTEGVNLRFENIDIASSSGKKWRSSAELIVYATVGK